MSGLRCNCIRNHSNCGGVSTRIWILVPCSIILSQNKNERIGKDMDKNITADDFVIRLLATETRELSVMRLQNG